MGASLYYPTVSTTSALYLTTPSVSVKATTPARQVWRLDVRNGRSGSIVRQLSGSYTTSIDAVWNLRDTAGELVPPDVYTLTLNSWTSRSKARPYTAKVGVMSPLPSGVAITHATGTPYLMVENGALAGVSPALAQAVKPGALPTFSGQRAGLPYVSAPPRDGLYVRSASSGTLYVVADGMRRAVSSGTASALGLTAPLSLPSAVLALLPQGPNWTDTARHPDGQVVKAGDGTTWRIESGVRRPFTSATSRARWAKGFAVPPALPADLALPLGAPLPPPEGTLLRTATGAGVVSDGAFRTLTDPAALGYAVTNAPVATADDLSALPSGEAVGTDRHPSGTLVKDGTAYVEILGASRRAVSPALLSSDPRVPVAPVAGELPGLTTARWTPPSGLAGRGADGTVRVVDHGRLVTLTAGVASALGYAAAELPALEAADFGPLPVAAALANPAAHPAGSVVTDGSAYWLLDAGFRRPLAASLALTWLGRPPLPATSADLALPAGAAAPPASGAWVVTEHGSYFLVDRAVRRPVTAAVAARLGLDAVSPQQVVAADLVASTFAGSPLP
jgi:hypothetical protein